MMRWILLLAVAACASCSKDLPSKARQSQPRTTPRAEPTEFLLQGSLPAMRAAMQAAYRLQPDRRMLRAVADIHHLVTRQARGQVEARFDGSRWNIRYLGSLVGELPERPDFPDALSMLTGWAGRLTKQAGWKLSAAGVTPEQPLDLADPLGPVRAADRLWSGGPTAAALRSATRALAALSLLTTDTMQTADEIPARALAVLAVDQAVSGQRIPREEAMLALAIGYDSAAHKAAANLAPTDDVRAYLDRNDALLERTPSMGYWWLRRLVRRGDHEGVENWFARNDRSWRSLPAVAIGVPSMRFEERRATAGAHPALVMELVGASGRTPGPGTRGLREVLRWVGAAKGARPPLQRFEAAVAEIGKGATGPFADAEIQQAYYRAHMYSSLYHEGTFLLRSLSSTPAARAFAAAIGAGQSQAGRDFRAWFLLLVRSQEGANVEQRLLDSLRGFPSFGAVALSAIYDRLVASADWGDPHLLGAVKRMVRRMDTRVEHRIILGSIAWNGLSDLRLVEDLFASATALAPGLYPGTEIWLAGFLGDRQKLELLLRDTTVPAEDRAMIPEKLEKLGALDSAGIRSAFDRLLDGGRAKWGAHSVVIDYLARKKDFGAIERVLRAWLHQNKEESLDRVLATMHLAGALYQRKRYEEGWRLVSPVVASQQRGAMLRGAFLHAALGRRDEAVQLAEAALTRYPASTVAAEVAAVHWRLGENDQAAQALRRAPSQLRLTEWRRPVGREFAQVFAGRPTVEGLAALEALQKVFPDPWALSGLAAECDAEKDHALAFAIQSRLQAPGLGNLELLTDAYRYLKLSKGRAEALAWLSQRVPPPMRAPLCLFARGDNRDLLWALVTPPPQAPDQADTVWTLRAVHAPKGRGLTPEQQVQLKQYFSQPGKTYYHTIGRYLLGLADEAAVVGLAKDPKTSCEVAYYLGRRALDENRPRDASDWYRLAIETGQPRVLEHRWAYDEVQAWKAKGVSLGRLASEGP